MGRWKWVGERRWEEKKKGFRDGRWRVLGRKKWEGERRWGEGGVREMGTGRKRGMRIKVGTGEELGKGCWVGEEDGWIDGEEAVGKGWGLRRK